MVRLSFTCVALAIALAVAPAAVHAQANAKTRAAPLTQDDRFLAAREAFRLGQYPKVAEQAQHLEGYVLESYVEYYLLRMKLEDLPPVAARDFLLKHHGTYIADQFRRDWLRTLVKRGEWEAFETEYPAIVGDEPELTCYALQARWRRGDESALDEFRRVWASPRELPEGCMPLAEGEIAAGRLTTRHVWDRVRSLLEAGQVGAAKRVIALLPANEMPNERTLDGIRRKPEAYIQRADKLDLKKRMNRELLLFAFARAARGDPERAHDLWTPKLQERLQAEERAWVWGQLATQGAKRHLPGVLEWYAKADGIALSEEQLEWRVRAALRDEDWSEVRDVVAHKMPPLQRNEPAWAYWQGRALAAGGKKDDSDAVYARLAAEHHFYGKLSREELGQPLAIPPRGRAPTAEEVARMAANPGLQRGLALLRLDQRTEGVREWNWALRGMDDGELLAAAEVARRAEMWDRAISAADRTIGVHDFNVRFLAPYRGVFTEQARAQGVEEPYVLALVRQESRFIPNAKSVAGASGLMQLMPRTARWVARQIGMKDYAPSRVTDVDVNITLGTSYLKYVLDELDGSPVLAAAAYNAGPGRARRWKADRPLEGAIYTETIPFSETRDYVKKVLSNTVYYAALYGGDEKPLKARLGTVPSRRGGEGYAATITGQATVE
ncbi:MAG TPA: transglycosylase SLT domain-containing protein [Burkholderiales bacterium]|nr:transglycosylase SLT domain-containing protein [Burkholderiales bacterium]